MLSAPMHAGTAAGAVSLKKTHHIITLQFSEVVKDHANCIKNVKSFVIQITLFDSIFNPLQLCVSAQCAHQTASLQPPRLLLLLYIPSTITAADGQFETNNHLAHSTLPHNSFARCYLLHIIWGGQLRYSVLLLSALFVTKQVLQYTYRYKNLLRKSFGTTRIFFVVLYGGHRQLEHVLIQK